MKIIILLLAFSSWANAGPYYNLGIDVVQGTATLRCSGTIGVAAGSATYNTNTITLDGINGNISLDGEMDGYDVGVEIANLSVSSANAEIELENIHTTTVTLTTRGNTIAVSTGTNLLAIQTTAQALTTHEALTGTSAHGATTANTASQIVARDASGNIAASEITVSTINAADVKGIFIYDDGDNLALFVKDGGNVGVGVSDPSTLFQVGVATLAVTKAGKVGIGTTAIPHGGIGTAMFAIEGADQSIGSGPHVQYTVDADDYPIFSQLNWGHDNVSLYFDAYYDSGYKSADAGSNFTIWKNSDKLSFKYDNGVAQGGAITWNEGITLEATGDVGIGMTNPAYALDVLNAIHTSSDVIVDGDLSIGGDISGTVGYFLENVDVKKDADETVNNSAVLQNDDDLVLTGITANTTQHFHLWVRILQGADATADFDYAIDFTNASEIGLVCKHFDKAGSRMVLYDTDNEEFNLDLAANDEAMINCDGLVYFSDTGAIQFTWAQEVATVIDTKVLLFSHMEIYKEH